MGREWELKYQADGGKIAAIREKFGLFSEISMETAYYDTPDRALGSRKWMLRLRYENGRAVCTLKTPLPDGSRGEWEAACDCIKDGMETLVQRGAPEALLNLTAHGVEEVCAARFTRLAKTLDIGDAVVELALDQGLLLGGGQTLPFTEVEVELKSGAETAAAEFAAALAAEFGLTPEKKSKAQQAMELLH